MGRRPEERPAGWGPEYVLEALRGDPELQVEALLEAVAPICGDRGVKPQALMVQICKWRRENRDFALAYRDLVAARKPPATGPHHASHDSHNPDWRQKWAVAFLATRSYVRAAEASGVDKDTLWTKRKPGHARFDQEFYDIYCACLEALKEHYEDVLNWAVEEAQLTGDAKTAGNLAITILERVDKARWTRAEDRSLTLTNNQNIHLTVELSEGAHKALRNAELLSNKLMGALGPGPAVIDVTPPAVKDRREALAVARKNCEMAIGTEATAKLDRAINAAMDHAAPEIEELVVALRDGVGPSN
jgi:hypothetical protein